MESGRLSTYTTPAITLGDEDGVMKKKKNVSGLYQHKVSKHFAVTM